MPETLLRDEMDLNWSAIKHTHDMILLFLVTILNSRASTRLRHRDLVNYNLIWGTLCIYCSSVSLASSPDRLLWDLPVSPLTCLKNSSRREVVQRWWRSQLLAGWLMSAVCSSRDRALGLSMLQKRASEKISQKKIVLHPNCRRCSKCLIISLFTVFSDLKQYFFHLRHRVQTHLQWRLWKNTSLEKNERTFPSVPEDGTGQKKNMWHRCMSTKEWVNLKSVQGTLLYWRWHCTVVHWLCFVAVPPGSESSHYDRHASYN